MFKLIRKESKRVWGYRGKVAHYAMLYFLASVALIAYEEIIRALPDYSPLNPIFPLMVVGLVETIYRIGRDSKDPN